jgi:S-layer family protein
MRLARTFLCSITLGAGIVSAALGAGPRSGTSRPDTPTTRTRPSRPLEFGVADYAVTSVFTGSMAADDTSVQVKVNDNGYRYFPGGAGQLIGSVSVPEGALIDHIGFNTCDAAGGSFTVLLYDSTVGTGFTQIGAFSSVANTCEILYNLDPLGYSMPANGGHNLEIYIAQGPSAAVDGTDGVQSVEVWWKRQVHPAPLAPTFPDVPPSDFGFQYVEALVSSGITGGCGGGNYCPDNPVTRRQMAIFIAKALGLHWPE